MCRPCYNAKRALHNVASKDAASKRNLQLLQEQDPEAYKGKVRSCRIIDPSVDEPGAPGVLDRSSRTTHLHQLMHSLTQTLAIKESGALVWLTEEEWVTHHAGKGTATVASAQDEWKKRAADASIQKMQRPGDAIRMAIMEPPRTEMYRERAVSKTVLGTTSIESSLQADDALRQVASVGVGAHTANSGIFGGMDAPFRPGVASGSSSGQVISFDDIGAAPTNMVVPGSTWEGSVRKHSRQLGRQLSGQLSEPLEGTSPLKKGRVGKAVLRGATGQLLEHRRNALELAASIATSYGKGTANVAKAVSKLAGKDGLTLGATVEGAIERHEQLLERAKCIQKAIGQWIMATAEAGVAELEKIAASLAQLSKTLQEARAAILSSRRERQTNRAKAANELSKKRARLTSMYKGSGVENMVRFLYEKGAFGGAASGQDADGEHAHGQEPDQHFVREWPAIALNDKECPHDRPAYFPAENGDGIGQQIRDTVALMGTDRVATAEKECLRLLAASGMGKAAKRLEPKGQPEDNIELLEWVPEHWRAAKMMPEALRAMGAPQLLVSMVGEARHGEEDWPLAGIGQFMVCVRGACVLMAWPVGSLMEKGCNVAKQDHFLFQECGPKVFTEWADKNCKYVDLHAGSAVWVPYGWFAASLARPSEAQHASVLVVPYVTKLMASGFAQWPAVADNLVRQVQELEKSGPKVWKAIGQSTVQWLSESKGASLAARTRALRDGAAPAAAACAASAAASGPASDAAHGSASDDDELEATAADDFCEAGSKEQEEAEAEGEKNEEEEATSGSESKEKPSKAHKVAATLKRRKRT